MKIQRYKNEIDLTEDDFSYTLDCKGGFAAVILMVMLKAMLQNQNSAEG